MDVGPAFIAHSQTAKLMQPGQGSLHHPPVDTQPTAMRGEPLGQHRSNPQRPQCPAVRSGIIGPVSLDLVGPATGTSSLASHFRNGLNQGQQLGHVMTVGSRHNSRQGSPIGVSNQVVFAPQLAPVSGIGPGFSPHRPRLGWKRYPPRHGTSQSGPLLAACATTVHEVAARPQLPASLADAANKSCLTHSPSPGAASPKGCRSLERTRRQSGPDDRQVAFGQGNAFVWSWVAAVTVESVPIVHRQLVPSSSASPPNQGKAKT
jgi:hypothetical protein